MKTPVEWASIRLDNHHKRCGKHCAIMPELHNDLLNAMLEAGL